MTKILSCSAFFYAATAASAAMAQGPIEDPWYVHAGPGRIALANHARMDAGGVLVPGAGLATHPQWTPVVEVGRFLTPGIALGLTVGVPPTVTFYGTGPLAPLGKLGSATYGPSALTAQWHPLGSKSKIDPYVGAGGSYMIIFDHKDAAMHITHIANDLGPVVQGGVNVSLSRHFGVFADVKKAWLHTDAYGTVGGGPVHAHFKMDPFVLNAGLAIRF